MSLRKFVTRHPRLAKLALKIWEWSDWTLPTEPDFRVFKWLKLRSGCFLDVGAHVGESARSFRMFNKTTPVLSIEPNPESFARLSRLQGRLTNFEARCAYASHCEQKFDLQIPVIDGIEFPSLGGDDCDRILERVTRSWGIDASRVTFKTQETQAIPLDSYELEVAMIKIDVEGHEHEVLHGLRQTIERYLPPIMLEIELEFIGQISSELGELGYQCMIYRPKQQRFRPYGQGEPLITQNAWFVPEQDRWQFPMVETSS
jgi:FkbM family methyltransferase